MFSRQWELSNRWCDSWNPHGRILAIVPDILRIDQFPNPAGDALKFLHVAHKFNFTVTGLETIALGAGLAAFARIPPAQLATAWSDMPELWIEFQPAESRVPEPNPRRIVGPIVLKYLLTTEQQFLAGHVLPLSQRDAGNPRRVAKRIERGPGLACSPSTAVMRAGFEAGLPSGRTYLESIRASAIGFVHH